MSLDYAENRIREALRLSNGHPLKARQQIIAWTYEDAKLLHALTKPHLTGIVAHAVSRVVSRLNLPEEQENAPRKRTKNVKVKPVEKEEEFGKDLLKALAQGDPAIFGQEAFSAPVKARKASKKHVDTMKLLSAQSRMKKK